MKYKSKLSYYNRACQYQKSTAVLFYGLISIHAGVFVFLLRIREVTGLYLSNSGLSFTLSIAAIFLISMLMTGTLGEGPGEQRLKAKEKKHEKKRLSERREYP